MSNVAVIVHTMDSYQFCWEGWEYYFNLFWDFDFPAPIYFANEEIDVKFNLPVAIKQLKTGKGEFSDRLMRALNAIPEQYVFYIQEDAWLQQTIDLFAIYDQFRSLDMNCFRICGESMIDTEIVKPFQAIDGMYLRKLKPPTNFLVAHAPSFWKKDFFLTCMVPNENPWDAEMNGTMRLLGAKQLNKIHNNPIYAGHCVIDPVLASRDFKIYLLLKAWYYAVSDRGHFNQRGRKLLERMKNRKWIRAV